MEYLKKVQELLQGFKNPEVIHIPRCHNKKAHALSKLAAVAFERLARNVKVETFKSPSIAEAPVLEIEVQEVNWMTPFLKYLKRGVVPGDPQEARRHRVRALQYEITDGVLYRRSYLGPSLKCLDVDEANYVIREIHEGMCGMHMGS
ncbi:uncharacterized protein LOC143587368 [Bidens hawaiensis]|uniref:uncharacterized protein LOC143587368 n=1 Tax=Bidens hawaiensis TaxID=980011 RepID=UPI004049483C